MDFITEQIIKKQKTAVDYLKLVLLLIAATVVMILMVGFLSNIPYIGSILFLLCAGIIYFIYRCITGLNVEFEYSFINGSLDVDKIIAARRRKHITTLNARSIEIMGTRNNRAFGSNMNNSEIKKLYACSDVNAEDLCFVIFEHKSKKAMLLFNPNEKIREGFKRVNPQNVFLDD